MYSSNIQMLETVAEGLRDLLPDVIFVGGAVAELYADNPELSDIRPTIDVDVVIKLKSQVDHYKLEEKLRDLGFKNDIRTGAPIIRWVYNGVTVDIMPDDINVLGFANQWHKKGMEEKIMKTLPNGKEIFLLSPVYYLASKMEALKDRGRSDLRQSHDFEDIIYLLDNHSEIIEQMKNASDDLKEYLAGSFYGLMSDRNIKEAVESALPYGTGEEHTNKIMNIMQQIVAVK